MPTYLFEGPDGEIKEVIQGMNDEHSYEEDGVKWNRVFTNPNMAVDTDGSAFDKDTFMRKTNKPMTVGDMWDISAEMAEKRIEKAGHDPIKEKTVSNYEKKTQKDHPLKNGDANSITHITT